MLAKMSHALCAKCSVLVQEHQPYQYGVPAYEEYIWAKCSVNFTELQDRVVEAALDYALYKDPQTQLRLHEATRILQGYLK